MRMLRFVCVAATLAPASALAQQSPPNDSVPRARQWAVEATVAPAASGAALLKFRSRSLAWRVAAEFSTSRAKFENESTVGDFEATNSVTLFDARLGVRHYRTVENDRIRPVVGGGIIGSISNFSNDDTNNWGAGLYGEIGAVYLVTPHFSLGGTAEVSGLYTRGESDNGIAGRTTRTSTNVSASLARLLVTVYF